MKGLSILLWLIAAVSVSPQTYKYPETPVRPVTDEYFGTSVTDNYRWLENLKDAEVQGWLRAQSDYTNTILASIPGSQTILGELKVNRTHISPNFLPIGKAAGRYFYGKQLPGEQLQKIYFRIGVNGKEVLLFDPQTYIPGKTFEFSARVSTDGSRLMLGLYEAGSELGDIRFLDVNTRTFLPDVLRHSRPISFAGETSTEGIYFEYKSYDINDPKNRLNMTAKLHVLGTPTESDLVLASADKYPDLLHPSDIPSVAVFRNSPYIFLSGINVNRNRTRFFAPKSDLKKPRIEWKQLTVVDDQVKDFFVRGSEVYFLTSRGNPNFKLLKINMARPGLENAKVIAEGTDGWTIDYAGLTKDYLVFNKSKNGLVARSMAYELKTGKLFEIAAPQTSNVYFNDISNEDNEILLVSNGWNTPEIVRSYDLTAKRFFGGVFDSSYDIPELRNVAFEEIEVASHDGVMVPLSIVYDRTRLKKDGSNVAVMDGYGAYGRTPLMPGFRPETLPLLKRGVVLAYAHVRGGGEKGNSWYLAGKKSTKPNTWKDLNACAEYLIKNKYTSAEKLGVTGASGGGIAIGRAITERPDLFRVAIIRVGLLNALRMEFSPNGPANIPEFGTVTLENEFRALLEMDAMHHVKPGVKYPAQLISAGINDSRVVYYIPAKFVAAMQTNTAGDNPVLLDINYSGGHSGGVTENEYFEQTSKEYAFLLWQTGDPEFQPRP
jgi:prolyl oligopeptidase